MRLKILSWNIWIDGDAQKVVDLIRHVDPDIIGLQEVKNDDPERDVIGSLSQLGYQQVFAPVKKTWGDKTYNDGPAIFSKYPIKQSKTYILSDINARAAVQGDIEVGDKTLHVFSTHLIHTHQQPSDVQDSQVENLLKVLPKTMTIVMGDFNATPESNAIRKMKEQLRDTDSSSAPTWSVYPEGCVTCNPQKIDTRLDYIFASKDLQSHDFKVEQSDASDHLPISAVLQF
jgi:endonuclease/exonuclease/phosphatase family metal-dependent hydrolase